MNNKYGISETSFEMLLKVISTFKDIDHAIIFGSRAKGTFKKGSDVDIAIYGASLQKDTAINLSAKLNEGTPIPYYIDIVAPQHLNKQELIDHIERVGVSFYKRK